LEERRRERRRRALPNAVKTEKENPNFGNDIKLNEDKILGSNQLTEITQKVDLNKLDEEDSKKLVDLKYKDKFDKNSLGHGNNNLPANLIIKHKEKSRELADRVVLENPNQIIEETNEIRDHIKDKIKNNLFAQLEKARRSEKLEKVNVNEQDNITEETRFEKLDQNKDQYKDHYLIEQESSFKDKVQQRLRTLKVYNLILIPNSAFISY
jgi:hypothetical protein